ncbi:MAG: hypothetical protein A2066_18815 [Bacteroidetes bacterium GWB2_41_8]|nr:MAG: hypothetical protein A2066_18815 [Bacteroidetes bacterium GWB2_41_8]
MVTFQNDSFTIEVKTVTNPIETWLETHNQLIDVLQLQDSEQLTNNFHVLELIREMMPDRQTAKRMIP